MRQEKSRRTRPDDADLRPHFHCPLLDDEKTKSLRPIYGQLEFYFRHDVALRLHSLPYPMRLRLNLIVLVAVLTACTSTQPPLVTTPPSEVKGAAVARRPLEAPAIPPSPPPSQAAPAPKIVAPANTQYVCVVDAKGKEQQTAIEFAPKVAALCRKHPEMGPCQYERNNCRASGGRVFAADGVEITMATEAEYDKKVMRVRFRAN